MIDQKTRDAFMKIVGKQPEDTTQEEALAACAETLRAVKAAAKKLADAVNGVPEAFDELFGHLIKPND